MRYVKVSDRAGVASGISNPASVNWPNAGSTKGVPACAVLLLIDAKTGAALVIVTARVVDLLPRVAPARVVRRFRSALSP